MNITVPAVAAPFAEIVEFSTDFIATTDVEGRILYANRAFRDRFGVASVEEFSRTAYSLFDFFSAASREEFFAEAIYQLWTLGRWNGEIEGVTADGQLIPLSQSAIAHFGADGRPQYFSGIARDITMDKAARAELSEAAALLSSVMGAAANEAIFVTDERSTIVAFSHGAELLLGYSAADVVGCMHPRTFHPHADIAATADALGIDEEALFQHPPADGRTIEREWSFVRRDGSVFDGSLTISARYDGQGRLCGFLNVARDITDRRRTEHELTRQARHDSLTGLANRAHLTAALTDAANLPQWNDPGRTVLFIDLDHFKQVNDTLGHAAGDRVLIEVGQRLLANLRDADLPARLGGDEFVVVLGTGVTPSGARNIAERIIAAVAIPFNIDDSTVEIGASIGLAVSDRSTTPDQLLLHADQAAYEAKRAGRGRLVTAHAEPR